MIRVKSLTGNFKKIGLILALAIFAIHMGPPFPVAPVLAREKTFPFVPGERLTYKVEWAFITAGVAVLEVLPMETVNGARAFHFAFTAKTTPMVDRIYKVRDRIDGYTDENMGRSLLYTEVKKGKEKRSITINFDWKGNRAQRVSPHKKRAPIPIMPGTFDLLSVYYAFRSFDLNGQKELALFVTDGKKCVLGRATVIRREAVRVESGTYDTYLVEPEMKHIGGVFKKSKNAKLQIWVTADDQKIPIKVKSKVIVGSFVAELVSIEQRDNPKSLR